MSVHSLSLPVYKIPEARVHAVSYQNMHEKVIDGVRQGDAKAQHELYKLYAKAMYNICVRILNNTAEAQDALQDAFLLAFTKIEEYRSEATFGAWLKRIVVNISLNYLRRRKAEWTDLNEADENSPALQTEHEAPEEEIPLRMEQINAAIQLLPDGFRVVLTLYLLEGYDHNEIAEILNISVSTSKSQYNRAKKRLKEILLQTYRHLNY
jgi:RNA polymerase sigma-70 factor (ECF subfamily)